MSRIEDGGAVEAGRDLVADLVKRSQTDPFHRLMTSLWDALAFRAAAAEITRLRAENAGMREALEPFAEEADLWNAFGETVVLVEPFSDLPGSSGLMVHHLRRARAALSKASQAEGQTP